MSDYFTSDVFMVPCVGQSLATNTDAGPSTFSDTYPLSYDIGLNNVNIQDMNTGFCEGFKMTADEAGVEIPGNFKIITCVVGTGGTSINTFVRGTDHYRQIVEAVRKAYENCAARGLTMTVPGFMWTQGEEDMRTGGTKELYGKGEWDPFEYGSELAGIIADLNKDIKEITHQDNDIDCYSYQVASHNTYARYPRIAFEQLKLAENNPHCLLAKTMYDVRYNIADYTHAPAATYRKMGNYYGMACFRTAVLHQKFSYTHPTTVHNKGAEIIIDFEVPCEPLTIDTQLVSNPEDGNFGFCIYNVPDELATSRENIGIFVSDTKIKSVEPISPTQVKLILNRPMNSDDVLTYGVNGDGWNNITGYNITGTEPKSGPELGARGCIRDSGLHCSWAPLFEYRPFP